MGMHHRLVMMIIRPAEKEKMCDQNIGKILFRQILPLQIFRFGKYRIFKLHSNQIRERNVKDSWNWRSVIFFYLI